MVPGAASVVNVVCHQLLLGNRDSLSLMTTLTSSLLTSVWTALHSVTLTLPHSQLPTPMTIPLHGRLAVGWVGRGMNDVSSSFLSFLYLLCDVHGVVPAQISTKLSSGLGLYVVFLLLNGAQKGCVARPCGFDRKLLAF